MVPGSVSFLAGLYPGDTIIEVNGVDMKYTPVENVVKAIQEGARKMERCVHAMYCLCVKTRPFGLFSGYWCSICNCVFEVSINIGF